MTDDIRELNDMCYPYVSKPGINEAQTVALFRKWKSDDQGMRWSDFFHSASETSFGAVVCYWCGMWLCIEVDGHTHT